MAEADSTEEVDLWLWAGMRERGGSRTADGEPTTETIDRVSGGDENWGEDNETDWPSNVDTGVTITEYQGRA